MFEPAGGAFGVSAALPDGLFGDVGSVLATLATEPGSPGAMALLAATDPTHLTLAERVDLVRAWERQLAWVVAGQLPAIAALEKPGADEGPDPRPEALCVPDWCREELAAALHLSGAAAQARLDLARDLAQRLTDTAEALRRGELTERKAGIIATAVRYLTDEHSAAVQTAVLPAAATQTPAELHRAVARALLEADPAGAAERAAEAARGRRVSSFPLPDGMGGIWAELPAAGMQTVIAGLDADAAKVKAALRQTGTPFQDIPGIGARRADALLGWAHRALAEPDLPTVGRRRPHIQVTVPINTLLGLQDRPGELAGYGPLDADTARRLAADGTWRRLLTDPASGVLRDYGRTVYQPPADLREFILARDPVCRFVGCQRPARRCQLDHITEWRDGGRTAADNLQPECLRHHICKTIGGWTVTRADNGSITWTSPAGKTYSNPPARIASTTQLPAVASDGAGDSYDSRPRPPPALPEHPPF